MTAVSQIRAVTFDVGGTLMAPWPSVGHVYAEVAARYGNKDLRPEKLNRQFARAWRQKKNFDHSRRAWFELVQKTFEGSVPLPAVSHFFEEVYNRFGQPEAWHVFNDVHPTLELLRRRGYQLGLISNWDERLRPLLEQLQLIRHFEASIISLEIGFAKPAPQIFQRAAAALRLPPERILHVGDSGTEDVKGAKAAGFGALLLDRKAEDCSTDRRITSLSQLEQRLATNSPSS